MYRSAFGGLKLCVEIKTQYFLEEIDAGGGMFPKGRRALMRGSHPRQHEPTPGRRYALLIDVAGEVEKYGIDEFHLIRVAALRHRDGPGVPDQEDRAHDVALGPANHRRLEGGMEVVLAGGERQDPALLRGRELGMLCGLARPASLRATLEGLGARVVAERSFPDHHRYRRADLAGLADEAPLWITTEKDAVKITPPWAGAADLRVLSIELAVDEADALLGWLEAYLR